MNRIVTLATAVILFCATLTLAAPAQASSAGSASPQRTWSMQDRFAREVVRTGDADTGTYYPAIEHVRELQYRLRWAHVFDGAITGYFGSRTHASVRRFQSRAGLQVSGVATHATWKELIQRTVRGKGAARGLCRGSGWNICYDRARHQVTLWRAGVLWNTWLVRGGGIGYETRTGTFRVFWRNRDHVSGIYGTPMPYSQFFSGGQAFHGSPFMTDPFVDHSHGCVNMYIEDARQLWSLTAGKRVDVKVYGGWD